MGHYSSVTVFPLSGLIVPLITPGHRQHTARYISDTTLTRRRWAWKSSNTSCMRNTHFVVISEDPLTSSGHVSWAPYSDTPTHCEYAPTPAPPQGGVEFFGKGHSTLLHLLGVFCPLISKSGLPSALQVQVLFTPPIFQTTAF